jgi:ubiquinone/menaquinone biosynthesis C-methylase UbiE
MTGAAEAYDRHVGRYGSQLASGLIEIAGVRRGVVVLDVGCGPGPLTAAVADVVGAQNVAAIDPSEPFVQACRRRVPGADVRVGTGEQLPFADAQFDVVLAQLVVQLMDDPVAGIREMVRVARPGGIVAALVWDSTTMPLLRSFWDAALAVAPDVAGAIDDARRVGYARPDVLADLWQTSGLLEIETGALLVHADYDSYDDLFEPFTTGTGHSGTCYGSLDNHHQQQLREEAHRQLGAPSEPFRLTARAWSVRGRVPA